MAKINTKIGAMKDRVLFQKERKIDDGSGGHESIWDGFALAWVEIIPLSGRERFYAGQISNNVTHQMRTRYRDDLDAQMRIKFATRYFLIESMFDINEEHRFLEFTCIEKKGLIR